MYQSARKQSNISLMPTKVYLFGFVVFETISRNSKFQCKYLKLKTAKIFNQS